MYLVIMNNKIKQLRKGILELAILGALEHQSHYGYSLIKHLKGDNGIDLTEGTIYPILSRLAREGLVSAEWGESRQGPPRKYYALTENGRKAYEILHNEFAMLRDLVTRSSRTPEEPEEDDVYTQIEMRKGAEDAS